MRKLTGSLEPGIGADFSCRRSGGNRCGGEDGRHLLAVYVAYGRTRGIRRGKLVRDRSGPAVSSARLHQCGTRRYRWGEAQTGTPADHTAACTPPATWHETNWYIGYPADPVPHV